LRPARVGSGEDDQSDRTGDPRARPPRTSHSRIPPRANALRARPN
jgi:hypothetical protein